MKEMYKGWKKTLLPQWIEKQRTHTLTHTGLWSDLAFYSLVTQTERKTESMSGSTQTFCVINKAEKEIQAEFTKQLHKVFQEHVFFSQTCTGVVMRHKYFDSVIVILFRIYTPPANQVYY